MKKLLLVLLYLIIPSLTYSATNIVTDTYTLSNTSDISGTLCNTGQVRTLVQRFPPNGIFGIINNRAYVSSGVLFNAFGLVYSSGVSDCTISIDMTVIEDSRGFLAFRLTDMNNFYYLTYNAFCPCLGVTKVQAGVETGLGSGVVTIFPDDTIGVDLSGSTITLLVNSSPVFSTSDSFNQTATLHGICDTLSVTGTTRWDNFKVDALGPSNTVTSTATSTATAAQTATQTRTATITPTSTVTSTPVVGTSTATITQTSTPVPTVSIKSSQKAVINSIDGTYRVDLGSGFTSSDYTVILTLEDGPVPGNFSRVTYSASARFFVLRAVDSSNKTVNCKFFPITVRWFVAQ